MITVKVFYPNINFIPKIKYLFLRHAITICFHSVVQLFPPQSLLIERILALLTDERTVFIEYERNWSAQRAEDSKNAHCPVSPNVFVKWYTCHNQSARGKIADNGTEGKC